MSAKRGRKPHEPTDISRRKVEALKSYGMADNDIILAMGFGSKMTLYKYYRHELDVGLANLIFAAGQTVTKLMITGQDERTRLAAAMFILTRRAGWAESQRVSHFGPGGGPIQAEVKQVEDFSGVPADQIDEKLRAEMAGV